MDIQESENLALFNCFIKEVKESLVVWGLKGQEGWAVCESIEFEETDVLPFFSSEAAALTLCIDEWQDYQPERLSLDEFLEDWLPGMHEDNAMVGIQWDNDLEGLEMEPADVAAGFN